MIVDFHSNTTYTSTWITAYLARLLLLKILYVLHEPCAIPCDHLLNQPAQLSILRRPRSVPRSFCLFARVPHVTARLLHASPTSAPSTMASALVNLIPLLHGYVSAVSYIVDRAYQEPLERFVYRPMFFLFPSPTEMHADALEDCHRA